MSGTVVARLIGLAAVPLLARLYDPAQYGFVTFALAITSITVTIATLEYQKAAMLPDDSDEVAALAYCSLLSTAVTAGLVWVALATMSALGAGGLETYPNLPVWVAILTVAQALSRTVFQLGLREKLYSEVGKRAVYQQFSMSLTQLTAGVIHPSTFGLMLGQVVGTLVGVWSVVRKIRYLFTRPNRRVMARAAKEFREFPLLFTPSSVLWSLGLRAPVLVTGALFSAEVIGQLGMAQKILGAPVLLIAGAAQQVLSAEFAAMSRKGRASFTPWYLRVTMALALVAIVVVGLAFAWGPRLAIVLLGETWADAGILIRVMAPAYGVFLVADPLASIFEVLMKGRANLLMSLLRVAATGAALATVLAAHAGPTAVVGALYSALAVVSIIQWIVGLNFARKADTEAGLELG